MLCIKALLKLSMNACAPCNATSAAFLERSASAAASSAALAAFIASITAFCVRLVCAHNARTRPPSPGSLMMTAFVGLSTGSISNTLRSGYCTPSTPDTNDSISPVSLAAFSEYLCVPIGNAGICIVTQCSCVPLTLPLSSYSSPSTVVTSPLNV